MARKDVEESPAGKKIAEKTGYDPIDLLKAPVEPPAPRNTTTPGSTQVLGIAVGSGLVIGAIAGWLVLGNALILIFAVLGAACVVAATLIKPGP